MSKKKGSVMDILYVGITVVAMTVVMVCYLNNMQLIGAKDDINQIARKYILRMETMGCLDSTGESNLIHDLQAMGMTDIDLAGTTMTDVGYGKPICLVIKGTLTSRDLDGGDIFNVLFQDTKVDIYEKRMSTAKN